METHDMYEYMNQRFLIQHLAPIGPGRELQSFNLHISSKVPTGKYILSPHFYASSIIYYPSSIINHPSSIIHHHFHHPPTHPSLHLSPAHFVSPPNCYYERYIHWTVIVGLHHL
ncbi:hypothetical protein ACMFMG_008464 [Clarireedia jacksonii]